MNESRDTGGPPLGCETGREPRRAPCDRCHEQSLVALRDIARMLATAGDQRALLHEILAVLDSLLGMRRATIMLLGPDGSGPVLEATLDDEGDLEAHSAEGAEVTRRVLASGLPAIVPRLPREPAIAERVFRSMARTQSERSFVCVPISVGSEVVGTLSADIPFEGVERLRESERVLSIVSAMLAHDALARRTALVERGALQAENLRLRDALGESLRPDRMVGNSRSIREVYLRISQVATSDTTVLIRGESGTGKELVAAALHYASARRGGPFVKVNCAALGEELLASELFGHEKGAFTGAVQQRKGRLEEAEGGTLFLDEIGEFSAATQVKLLRVLQEREYERVGSNRTIRADVRVLCATNRDLEAAVAERAFREDLYYRINVFPIIIPPLRERRDDILLLADHFVQSLAARSGKTVHRISTPAINMLFAYHWPGNVRELQNAIEHAVLLTSDGVIREHHLPPTLQLPTGDDEASARTLKARVQAMEREAILDALKRSEGNVTAAARELGITARMVRYKMQILGLAEDATALRPSKRPSRPPRP